MPTKNNARRRTSKRAKVSIQIPTDFNTFKLERAKEARNEGILAVVVLIVCFGVPTLMSAIRLGWV